MSARNCKETSVVRKEWQKKLQREFLKDKRWSYSSGKGAMRNFKVFSISFMYNGGNIAMFSKDYFGYRWDKGNLD